MLKHPDWHSLRKSYPIAFEQLLAHLETPQLTKVMLLFGRMGTPYRYRDLIDVIDLFNISYIVEKWDTGYNCHVYKNMAIDDVDFFTFETRFEAEMFGIDKCFSYLETELKKRIN